MCEVAMLHRPSRTLLLVDLLENFTDATPGVNWLVRASFKVFGMWNNPTPAPEYRFAWKDRHAARESLQRILAWDFERIVISHIKRPPRTSTCSSSAATDAGASSPRTLS